MEAKTHRPTWKTLLAFAIIYFVWGSTFLAIRIGVREVPGVNTNPLPVPPRRPVPSRDGPNTSMRTTLALTAEATLETVREYASSASLSAPSGDTTQPSGCGGFSVVRNFILAFDGYLALRDSSLYVRSTSLHGSDRSHVHGLFWGGAGGGRSLELALPRSAKRDVIGPFRTMLVGNCAGCLRKDGIEQEPPMRGARRFTGLH